MAGVAFCRALHYFCAIYPFICSLLSGAKRGHTSSGIATSRLPLHPCKMLPFALGSPFPFPSAYCLVSCLYFACCPMPVNTQDKRTHKFCGFRVHGLCWREANVRRQRRAPPRPLTPTQVTAASWQYEQRAEYSVCMSWYQI